MHRANFSDVRSFLLEHTRLILQDDSGIPVNRFDQASWRLRPFGHYTGPLLCSLTGINRNSHSYLISVRLN